MEEKAKKIAELLKVLANEHRLLILCALMKGCLTVGEIHKYCPAITASSTANKKANKEMSIFQRLGGIKNEVSGI